MFHLGQKVVCIEDLTWVEDSDWGRALGLTAPVKGSVYTIRRMVQRPLGDDVAYALMLHEIHNPACNLVRDQVGSMFTEPQDRLPEQDEPSFDARCFRPLLEVKDFISTDESAPVRTPAKEVAQ